MARTALDAGEQIMLHRYSEALPEEWQDILLKGTQRGL